jgi:hypothetical protein
MSASVATLGKRRSEHRRPTHRQLRQGLLVYVGSSSILTLLTAPMIYSLMLPLALIDLWVTLYQLVCFPIYGIPYVPRRAFLIVDRHKLAYLNAVEKMNCTFCSYANGLLAYVAEVTACTEQYWCPIKHRIPPSRSHRRYEYFFEYGDGTAYRTQLTAVRSALGPRVSRPKNHRSRRDA